MMMTTLPAIPLAPHELPPPGFNRWTVDKKILVVRAVSEGLLTVAEASARYALSLEEFLHWRSQYIHYGSHALKVTRIKKYRQSKGPLKGLSK